MCSAHKEANTSHWLYFSCLCFCVFLPVRCHLQLVYVLQVRRGVKTNSSGFIVKLNASSIIPDVWRSVWILTNRSEKSIKPRVWITSSLIKIKDLQGLWGLRDLMLWKGLFCIINAYFWFCNSFLLILCLYNDTSWQVVQFEASSAALWIPFKKLLLLEKTSTKP